MALTSSNQGVALLVALTFLMSSASPSRADDWPVIQKDSVHSGSSARGPVPPLKLAWKATGQSAQGNFTTWPVVYDGIVYASSGPGILAVDAATGTKKWFSAPAEGQNIVAPAVDEVGVYIPIGENQVLALDRLTGEELWRFRGAGSFEASPTLSEGRLYLGSAEGKTFYCIDARTGRVIWKSEQDLDPFNVPVASRGMVVFSVRDLDSPNAFVIALSADSGDEIWRVPQHETTSSPAVLDDKVIVGNGNRAVLAYEIGSGRQVWSSPILNLIGAESSPAIAFGDVFVADRTGNFYRIDGSTGKQEWIFTDTEGTFNQSYPVVAGRTMYIGGGAGWLHALDVDTGKELWKEQIGGSIHFGAVDADRIYLGVKFGDEGLYAFEHDTDGRLESEKSQFRIVWAVALIVLGGLGFLWFLRQRKRSRSGSGWS
jgi:outer membrane protein assembly factor BamB